MQRVPPPLHRLPLLPLLPSLQQHAPLVQPPLLVLLLQALLSRLRYALLLEPLLRVVALLPPFQQHVLLLHPLMQVAALLPPFPQRVLLLQT